MSNDETIDTVVPFRVVPNDSNSESAKPDKDEATYLITDIDGNEFEYTGFLIFTSHHVAIMTEVQKGVAAPVFLLPLNMLRMAQMLEN